MPEMSGIDFIHTIRQDADCMDCYIIMISARNGTKRYRPRARCRRKRLPNKTVSNPGNAFPVRSGMRIRFLEKKLLEEVKKLTVLEMALSVADKIGNPIAAAKMYALKACKGKRIQHRPQKTFRITKKHGRVVQACCWRRSI